MLPIMMLMLLYRLLNKYNGTGLVARVFFVYADHDVTLTVELVKQ